jgi:hypothetical protein
MTATSAAPSCGVRPDCLCWCQVRPVVCALSCCGCIVHDHGDDKDGHVARRTDSEGS